MRGQLGGSLALLGFVLTFGLAGTLLATWDCLCNLHADRIVASRKSLPHHDTAPMGATRGLFY